MEAAVLAFLQAAGFDAVGSLAQTPRRVALAWADDLLDGYDRPAELEGTEAGSPDLVVVAGIEFASTCPHHLMPYHGAAAVAYLPGERLAGFSALTRLVDRHARRLTLQEWLARDVAGELMSALGARGAACVIDAVPTCAAVRGERRSARVRTCCFLGELDAPGTRAEVLSALPRP